MLRATNTRQDLPDVEIGYSLVRLLGLVCAALLMLLLCASLAFDWLPRTRSGPIHVIVGYAGIFLFGVAIWKSIRIFLSPRAPVIIVSRDGIQDSRTSRGLIPWQSVEAISLRQTRAQTVVILKIRTADSAQYFTTRTARFVRWSNTLLGGARADGIWIGTTGLTMQAAELFDLCNTYHAAVRGVVTANWR